MTPELLVREEIRALAAYRVQPSAGLIKLDAMENPYLLPEALQRELAERLASASINRYPDPTAAPLKDAINSAFGIPKEMALLLGNGSDEIIQILAQAVARSGATVMSVEPAFVMFEMIAKICGLRYVGVPLNADFSLDVAAMLDALRDHQPALVFLAYPNNPTGNLFDVASMEAIIAASPGLVVIDEAYSAFSPSSFLDRLVDFPNVVLMRTVSKLGLAGLRIGYLVGRPALIAEFDKVRLPYNINVLSQMAAQFALEHIHILKGQAAALVSARGELATALANIRNVIVYPSQANFLLLRVPNAARTFEGLKSRGILIKNLSAAHPLLHNCLRVTVSTPEENAAFLAALNAAM